MRKKLFWGCMLVYLAIAGADATVTWLSTPDLSQEGNPLVLLFGMGWGALIVANLVGIVLYALALWCALRYRSAGLHVRSFGEFYHKVFYRGTENGRACVNWNAFFAALGFAYSVAFPLWRCVVVSEWLMLRANIEITVKNAVDRFFANGVCGFNEALLLLILLFSLFFWLRREYNNTQTDYNK